jgi:hypothetical protein
VTGAPRVPDTPPPAVERHLPFFFWGVAAVGFGLVLYFLGLAASIVRLAFAASPDWRTWNQMIVWYSGAPATVGLLLIGLDLMLGLPERRRRNRRPFEPKPVTGVTVALTAYNDEASIADAVRDFRHHPLVARVLVVNNYSSDATAARAAEAGAIVHDEPRPGYGSCVYRCFLEASRYTDTSHVVLCEGDMTFRARDLDKLAAYAAHASVVNGTRIVEQLRDPDTQLSTFMFYGNFIGGKLLEARHFGKGTFTDLGTTYKLLDRSTLADLMPLLDPAINLEFNAHFLDIALHHSFSIVECPVTFHARVGHSKGGNVNNVRAAKVGLRMLIGMSLGWKWLR